MKVRDIFPVFTNANEVRIAYGGNLSGEDLRDPVVMAAYGDFRVRDVHLYPVENAKAMKSGQVDVELHLELAPLREVAR